MTEIQSPQPAPQPCPFCGSVVVSREGFHMACIRCGADGPDGDWADEQAAITAWNRRDKYPEPAPKANDQNCPHCNYTGTAHCGDVAEKIRANGGDPRDCSNAKAYGLRGTRTALGMAPDLVHRLRVAAEEWLPTTEHTLKAHKLLTEAADALEAAARYPLSRFGFEAVINPNIPAGVIRLYQDGKLVGEIQNIKALS